MKRVLTHTIKVTAKLRCNSGFQDSDIEYWNDRVEEIESSLKEELSALGEVIRADSVDCK